MTVNRSRVSVSPSTRLTRRPGATSVSGTEMAAAASRGVSRAVRPAALRYWTPGQVDEQLGRLPVVQGGQDGLVGGRCGVGVDVSGEAAHDGPGGGPDAGGGDPRLAERARVRSVDQGLHGSAFGPLAASPLVLGL